MLQIPVFDPHSWALLYIPCGENRLPPHSPSDFLLPDGKFLPRKFRVVSKTSEVQEYAFDSRASLLDAMHLLANDTIVQSAGTLFTIHNLGLLQRLHRWATLRAHSHGMDGPNALPGTIVDMVEEWHRPAIITYEQRRHFQWRDIYRWMELAPVTNTPQGVEPDAFVLEQNVLMSLCQLWTP